MEKNAPSPQALVFWVIWASLLGGVVMYPFMLGDGLPSGPNSEAPISPVIWILGAGSFLVAAFIRWIVLPRIKSLQSQLPPFVIGIAVGEAIVFYGLFLVGPEYPQTQLAFFVISFLAVAQFIPVFTRPGRFDPNAGRMART